MTCPHCHSFVRREPATITCSACGRFAEVLDADDDQRFAQRWRDWILRPRSIECWPEYQTFRASPVRLGRGWVNLPGEPAQKRKR